MSISKLAVAVFIFTFSLCVQDSSSDTATTAAKFIHPKYEIKASIDSAHKIINASEKVLFTNNSTYVVDSLYFHVYPHRQYTENEKSILMRYAGFFKVDPFPEGFQTPEVKLAKVQVQGTDAAHSYEGEDGTILKIDLAQPLLSAETVEVTIDFSVSIPHAYGRFGWNENVFAVSRWYPILSVLKDDGWKNYPFYPFHRPFYSDSAYYSVELTIDADQTPAHSGELIREEAVSDGKKKLFIDSKFPIREFSLAMSKDYQYIDEELNGVRLRSFYLPEGKAHAQKALQSAKDMFVFYSSRLGEYPYKIFNLVPVHLGYGGEQMSNMAFFDTRVYSLPGFLDRYLDFLIAHETGHQWFYNLVGSDGFKEMWIEEGIHSHFLLDYLENKYGANAEILNWPSWLEGVKWMFPEFTFRRSREVRYKMISRIGLDHEVVGELSSFMEPSSIFSVTYGKGSRITGMLRDYMGEEAFTRAFKRIFEQYRFKNISVAELFQVCEQESGKELDSFAQQWLYTDGYFDGAITKVEGNKVSLRHLGRVRMPASVKVKYADGTEEKVFWDQTEDEGEILFSGKAAIKSVEIDPEKILLDFDLTNNRWPSRLNVKPVPYYFGLYDVPVFLPDDGYNLVFGPEIANGGPGVKVSLQKPYDQHVYAATSYDFSEGLHHSRGGYQISNLFDSQTALGVEVANRTDYDGDEDLASGQIFLRKELWPIQYGLSSINDHVTLYVLRNQGLEPTLILGGSEDARNFSYLKRSEAIVGTNIHFERLAPYPDPYQGYKANFMVENSGHFLGATQHFSRAAIDASIYAKVTQKSKLAFRFKLGGGFPDDKNLFQLGGFDGLRGYDRKELRGANALLGSLEYRFPIKDKLHWAVLDNALSIDEIGGVLFFDAGHNWYSSFDESTLKKDAGVGLRATVNIGSYFEKLILRADVAQPINEDTLDDETHYWFGVNHAF
jgi:hypothetical protein